MQSHILSVFVLVQNFSHPTSRNNFFEDEKVERAPVRSVRILVARSNEVRSTKLASELLLGVGVRDGSDLLGAQSLGKDKGKVAKAADTNETDSLEALGTATVEFERVVHGNTSSHERGSYGRREALGDVDSKVSGSTRVLGVFTHREARAFSLGVVAVVGTNNAIVLPWLLASFARLALLARVGLSTNADTVADLEALDFLANTRDGTDDLVSNLSERDAEATEKSVFLLSGFMPAAQVILNASFIFNEPAYHETVFEMDRTT